MRFDQSNNECSRIKQKRVLEVFEKRVYNFYYFRLTDVIGNTQPLQKTTTTTVTKITLSFSNIIIFWLSNSDPKKNVRWHYICYFAFGLYIMGQSNPISVRDESQKMDLFIFWPLSCWSGVWIQFITSSIFSCFTYLPCQIVAEKISSLG